MQPCANVQFYLWSLVLVWQMSPESLDMYGELINRCELY